MHDQQQPKLQRTCPNPEPHKAHDWDFIRHCAGASRKCRRVCFWCVLQTIGFPIEHLAWEKLPVLSSLTHLLGL